MIKPKVVLLIFVSGKIVLTGAKVCTFLSMSKAQDVFVDIAFMSDSRLDALFF